MSIYCIAHPDGRYLYSVSTGAARSSWGPANRLLYGKLADGTTVATNHLRDTWYASENELASIVVETARPNETIGYKLNDSSALSVRFPEKLSPEEFQTRCDEDDELFYSMYDRITQSVAPTRETFEGPWPVMEGREPPNPGEPRWIAKLPYELSQRPEYLHLFPGSIPGLKEHLHEVVKGLPRVEHCFDGYKNYTGLHVTVMVPYNPGMTNWVRYTGSSGKPLKRGRNVTQHKRRVLQLPVPDRVTGENYEDALRKWDEQVQYWVGVVEDASVTACGHCMGDGFINEGSTKYEEENKS